MKSLSLLCCFALLFLSCTNDDIVHPADDAAYLLRDTTPLTSSMRSSLEGVYRVVTGSDMFGELVALKWSYVTTGTDTTFHLSGFFGHDIAFFSVQSGTLDSVFLFAGSWRKMINTETGILHMRISTDDGGRRLFQSTPISRDSILISGSFGNGSEDPSHSLVLVYDRPLNATGLDDVIAHRAGGRNSDLLPHSENSVEMVLYTQQLGSTGIEIDVRMTADQVPVIYHDANINLRLTRKSGLVGPITEYTYAQLNTFVRLIHGEKIPTLREILDAALYRTSINVVWLDMKTNQVGPVEAIRAEYAALAAQLGRQFTIYIGLPTQDVFDAFVNQPNHQNIPSLCEIGVDQTRQVNARIWAPRWTDGLQIDLAEQMHAEGRRVYTWTLDDPAYVQQYMVNGRFDGILTNFPTIVAYNNYVR